MTRFFYRGQSALTGNEPPDPTGPWNEFFNKVTLDWGTSQSRKFEFKIEEFQPGVSDKLVVKLNGNFLLQVDAEDPYSSYWWDQAIQDVMELEPEVSECDQVQATHFQIRWEFDRLTSNSDGDSSLYLLSPVTPISSALNGTVLVSPTFNNNKVTARIRFCDEAGNIALYKGSGFFAPVGGLKPIFIKQLPNEIEISTSISQTVDSEVNLATGNFQASTYVEIGESQVIEEPDCSGLIAEEPPEVTPVEPPEVPDPQDPPDDQEPEIIDEPLPPEPGTPPEPPQSGCECEIYLAHQLSFAIQEHQKQLSYKIEKLIVAIKNHTQIQTTDLNNFKSLFKTLFENLFENVAYNLELMRGYVSDINQQLMVLQSRFVDDEENNIAQIHAEVFRSTENPEMTITDVIENQPVPIIENEYRVSSERSVDFLDAYNDKNQE